MSRVTRVLRVATAVVLALAAGAVGGSLLFGDEGDAWPLPILLAGLVLAHAALGLVLGLLAGRAWVVALLSAWGAALAGFACLLARDWPIGLVGIAAAPAATLAGAWWGGRLATGSGRAAED